jgi:hypothetical protein
MRLNSICWLKYDIDHPTKRVPPIAQQCLQYGLHESISVPIWKLKYSGRDRTGSAQSCWCFTCSRAIYSGTLLGCLFDGQVVVLPHYNPINIVHVLLMVRCLGSPCKWPEVSLPSTSNLQCHGFLVWHRQIALYEEAQLVAEPYLNAGTRLPASDSKQSSSLRGPPLTSCSSFKGQRPGIPYFSSSKQCGTV